MDELSFVKELFGLSGAVTFAIVFGVVFAVRKTAIDDVKERLIGVENDIKWIKKALGAKDGDE